MIKVKIFCGNNNFDNPSNWRAHMQYGDEIEGVDVKYYSDNIANLNEDIKYDVIIFSRPIMGCLDYIKQLKKNNIKIIVDYDDPLPLVFSEVNLETHFNETLQIIQEVDVITTTTEQLKEYFYLHSFNKNIKVLPNILNKSFVSENKVYHNDKVVLGWFGNSGHYESLKKIKDVIINILNEYENVYFNLYAPTQSFFDLFDHPKVNKIMYVFNFSEFQENIGDIDINLAPLNENYHNFFKSNIRIILPGFKGIPSVADNFSEYKLLGNENVLLCETNEDWYNNIKKLINDPELRFNIGLNIKKYITNNLSYESWKSEKSKMFKSLINK